MGKTLKHSKLRYDDDFDDFTDYSDDEEIYNKKKNKEQNIRLSKANKYSSIEHLDEEQ